MDSEDQSYEPSEPSSTTPFQYRAPPPPPRDVTGQTPPLPTQSPSPTNSLSTDGATVSSETEHDLTNIDVQQWNGTTQKDAHVKDDVNHPHGHAHQLTTIPHVDMHVTAEQDVSGQSDEKRVKNVRSKRQKKVAPLPRASTRDQPYRRAKTRPVKPLPNEMISMIVANTTSTADLARLAKVSKAFHTGAQAALYKTLNHAEWNENWSPFGSSLYRKHYVSATQRLLVFVRTLLENPKLAELVENAFMGSFNQRLNRFGLGSAFGENEPKHIGPWKPIFETMDKMTEHVGLFRADHEVLRESLFCLILAICPNIKVLNLGKVLNWEYDLVEPLAALTMKQPSSMFRGNLSSIHTVQIAQGSALWANSFMQSLDLYLQLPTIRTIHCADVVRSLNTSQFHPANSSNVKSLIFENSALKGGLLARILRQPKALEKFSLFWKLVRTTDEDVSISITIRRLGESLRQQMHSLKDIEISEYSGFNPEYFNRRRVFPVPVFNLLNSPLDTLEINGVEKVLTESQKDFSHRPAQGHYSKLGSFVNFVHLERLNIPSRNFVGKSSKDPCLSRLWHLLPASLVHLRLQNLHYWVFMDVERLLSEKELWAPSLRKMELVVQEPSKLPWGPKYKMGDASRARLMTLAAQKRVDLFIDERY